MIRNNKGTLEISESRDVDLDSRLCSDVDEHLSEVSAGLRNPVLSIESDYEYGDSIVRQYITGWRDATPQEIEQDRHQREAATRHQRERQERLASTLKIERPDLFQ